MLNSTNFSTNASQVAFPVPQYNWNVRLAVGFMIIVCFFFFAYFVAVTLNVFLRMPQLQENARYILFVHMLINDSVYFVFGLIMLFAVIVRAPIPGPICYALVTLSSATFKATPYTLSTMALERYVAICFPLQHYKLCSVQMAKVAILLIWVLGSTPYICEIIVVLSTSSNKLSSLYVICTQQTVILVPFQNTLRLLSLVLLFTIVGLIIICTYIQIVIIAHKISSRSSLASKASKTIMLHAFQLCLCMASLLSVLTETFPYNFIDFLPLVNFFVYTCLPRFLSPVIYGLRDELLRKYIRQEVLKNLHCFLNSKR
ncbi:PREDICTED: olfactory receptor 9A2-like [Nanorana parkeri]|uniref:olfactory receptor 9A2-like n=1 Tax=Nanorana parkeri TaxID=125878 RepID=UPI00085509EE|nr:PREDICTED: olfactory receptor 9A2-like [Nanorana parkeri]